MTETSEKKQRGKILYDEDGMPTGVDWQLDGKIKVGDTLIWEPLMSCCKEEIRVTRLKCNAYEELQIETMNESGEVCWNSEDTIRESCVRAKR